MFRDKFYIPGQLSGGQVREVRPENLGKQRRKKGPPHCLRAEYIMLISNSCGEWLKSHTACPSSKIPEAAFGRIGGPSAPLASREERRETSRTKPSRVVLLASAARSLRPGRDMAGPPRASPCRGGRGLGPAGPGRCLCALPRRPCLSPAASLGECWKQRQGATRPAH